MTFTDRSDGSADEAARQYNDEMQAERHLDLMHEREPDQWAEREPDPTHDEIAEDLARDIAEHRIEVEDPEPHRRPIFELDDEVALAIPIVRAQAERGEDVTARAQLLISEALDAALDLLDVQLTVRRDPPRRHPCCTCTDGMYSYGSVAAIREGDTDPHCPIHGMENALRA